MSNYEKNNLRLEASNLSTGEAFLPWTRVEITDGDNVLFSSGNSSGRTMTVKNPWGTQAMADTLLANMGQTTYKPFSSDGAYISPAAELGDAVTIKDHHGGVYSMDYNMGGLSIASISAPGESDIDHEIPYISKTQRETTRAINGVQSFAISGFSSMGGRMSALEKKEDEDYNNCLASITEAQAGLEALVKKNADGSYSASASLWAAIGEEVSSQIEVHAYKDSGGSSYSVASIQADLVNVKSEINTIKSTKTSFVGNVTIAKGHLTVDDYIYAGGTSVFTNASVTSTFKVGGYAYSAQTITSTSGTTYQVLGR